LERGIFVELIEHFFRLRPRFSSITIEDRFESDSSRPNRKISFKLFLADEFRHALDQSSFVDLIKGNSETTYGGGFALIAPNASQYRRIVTRTFGR